MEVNEIINLCLGGGLMAAIISVLTMRATVRKANAVAEKAKAEAETVRIDNTEHATKVLIENIVKPLKVELSETRDELRETKREFSSTKREMARLRKAVESASNCDYSDKCPVINKLRDNTEDGSCEYFKQHPSPKERQPCKGDKGSDDRSRSYVHGELTDTH